MAEIIEVLDEGNQVVLIFPDNTTLADYDRAQVSDPPFDYHRIEARALDLRTRLDDFLDDLRRLPPFRTPVAGRA